LSLQTLSSGERRRRAPFLTVLWTHCISRSRSFPFPRIACQPAPPPPPRLPALRHTHTQPCPSGSASKYHMYTQHAVWASPHLRCGLHRMRVAGIRWKGFAADPGRRSAMDHSVRAQRSRAEDTSAAMRSRPSRPPPPPGRHFPFSPSTISFHTHPCAPALLSAQCLPMLVHEERAGPCVGVIIGFY